MKGDDETNSAIPRRVRYEYASFSPGTVIYKDKGFSKALLNYNLLSGHMQFLKEKDTLDVADAAIIQYIAIGTDTFYADKGFLKLITGNETGKLAKKETLQLADMRKLNSEGKPDFIGNLTIISSINDRGKISKLSENIEITIVKRTQYFIGDSYDSFLPANKKNIYKLFGKKEPLLNAYFSGAQYQLQQGRRLGATVDFLGKYP